MMLVVLIMMPIITKICRTAALVLLMAVVGPMLIDVGFIVGWLSLWLTSIRLHSVIVFDVH